VCCRERDANTLCRPEVFTVMTEAVVHYIGAHRWWVDLWLAMPDHWHGLIAFSRADTPSRVIQDWKRYVARTAGVKWQDGFFDHRLRNRQSAAEKWTYISENPVRRGLCATDTAWPWRWEPETERTMMPSDPK
jgi:REP element-mobilizing transposase RayT